MKKRFLSMLLVFAMVFSLLPAFSVTALAGTGATFDDRFGGMYSEFGGGGYTTYTDLATGTDYTVHDDVQYTFAGWYTGIDGKGIELTGTPSDITYYAKWTKDGKTVVTVPLDFCNSVTLPDNSGITWNAGNLTLNGATIDVYADSSFAVKLPANATITITDSTTNTVILNDLSKSYNGYVIDSVGALTVNGSGTLNIIEAGIPEEISVYGIRSIGDFNYSDATVNISAENTAIVVGDGTNKADAIISSGTISATISSVEKDGADGIHTLKGDITISNGTVTVTNSKQAIVAGVAATADSGALTISGGTVSATGTSTGLWSSGKMTISGGTVTATATGTSGNDYAINSQTGNVIISGGFVTADGAEYGIRSKAGNITISGTNTDIIAKGGTAAFYPLATNMNLNAKDFTIVANDSKDNTGAAVEMTQDDNGDITTGTDLAKYVSIKSMTRVCKIRTEEYTSITKALEAAGTTTTTIELIADVTENITIEKGQNIHLNLNGHVINGKGDCSICNNGELWIVDDSKDATTRYWVPDSTGLWVLQDTLPSGTLGTDYYTTTGSCITGLVGYGSNKWGGIYNNGDLRINNVDLVGNTSDMGGAVYNMDGKSLNVENSEVMGNTAACVAGGIANRGTAMITNCQIAYNKSDEVGGIWSKGALTLNGAEITNNVTADTDSDPSDNDYPSAGVYSYSGTVVIGSKVVIKDNKSLIVNGSSSVNENANLVIAGDVRLNVSYLSTNSDIGISKLTSEDVVTLGRLTKDGTATGEMKACFTADNELYAVKFNNNETSAVKTDDYLELVYVEPTFDDRFGNQYGLFGNEPENCATYSDLVIGNEYTVYGETKYEFAGWYTGIDGAGTALGTATPKDKVTYYAKWLNASGNVVVTTSMNFKNATPSDIPEESGITWNATTKTVTLENATIDTTAQVGLNLPADSDVKVYGSNTVKSTLDGDATNNKTAGIYSDRPGTLDISGDGTLNVYSGSIKQVATETTLTDDRLSAGIYVNGDLSIDGITLYAESGDVVFGENKIYGCVKFGRSAGIRSTGKISINDATVTAKAGNGSDETNSHNGFSIGINSFNNIEITDSTVTATSGRAKQDSDGIYAGADFVTATDLTAFGANNKYLANVIIKNSTVTATGGMGSTNTIGIYAHNNIEITDSIVTAKNSNTGKGGQYAAGIFRNQDLVINNSTVTVEAYGSGIYTYSHADEKQGSDTQTAVFGKTEIKNDSTVTVNCLEDFTRLYDTKGLAMLACSELTVADSTLTCNVATNGDLAILFDDPNRGAREFEGLVLTGTGKIVTNGVVRVGLSSDTDLYYFGNTSDKKYPVTNGTSAYLDGTVNVVTPTAAVMTISAAPSVSDDNDYVLPSYNVTVNEAAHGTITASTKNAYSGNTVTLTVKADSGYMLDTLTVVYGDGKEASLKTVKFGETYTFRMPAGQVTVKATFKSIATFVDVKESEYWYDAVLWATEKGITTGIDETHFAPYNNTTRAQMVTFLWRLAGSPEPTITSCKFTDLNPNAYYYKAVLWAVENGITEGTGETTFSPNANVTRAQAVTFLWRNNGSIKFANMTANGPAPSPFEDVATDAYYYSAVLWANAQGITEGTGETTFSPSDNSTRGQVVTFLYRSEEE